MWCFILISVVFLTGSEAAICEEQPQKDAADCGTYYSCGTGKPFKETCPPGLGFNPKKQVCDWADMIEECDVEAFLDFECPAFTAYDAPGSNQAFPFPGDCGKQIVCVPYEFEEFKRVPRLLSCDKPQVFNPETRQCDYYKEVAGCETYYPPVQKVKPVEDDVRRDVPERKTVSRTPTGRPNIPEVKRTVTTKTTKKPEEKTTKKPEESEDEE